MPKLSIQREQSPRQDNVIVLGADRNGKHVSTSPKGLFAGQSMSQAWIEDFLSESLALKEREEKLLDQQLWAILFLTVGNGTPESGPRKIRVVRVDGKNLLEIEPGLPVRVPAEPATSEPASYGGDVRTIIEILVKRKLAANVGEARTMIRERKVAVVDHGGNRSWKGQFATAIRGGAASIVSSPAAEFRRGIPVIIRPKSKNARRRSRQLRVALRRLGTAKA